MLFKWWQKIVNLFRDNEKGKLVSDLNQNARNLIEYYCSMQVAPEYALLVKGSWGCGKSHLVKDTIKIMKHENEAYKFLYVSLYGVNNIADIEAKFFEQLNPILASKKMMFAGQIAKGILKGALKIDLDGDGKPDVSANVSVPDINLAKYLTDTKNCILVFDDLERCSIDIQVILGYLNYFVEKDGYKVLIIADESKLISLYGDSSQLNIKYQNVKEKLIGKTIEIEADVERVFGYFVQELVSKLHQDQFKKYKHVIIRAFTDSGYKNLRSLRKCFLDLDRWFEFLDSDVLSKDALMDHFLSLFVSISMEIHAGSICNEQLGKLLGFEYDYLSLLADDEIDHAAREFNLVKEKYSINFNDSIIELKIWKDFFSKGFIDRNNLNRSFKQSKYFADETTPDWKKLWYFYALEDADFLVLQNSVLSSFNKREYTNLCELKHVAGIFLWHLKNGLLNKSAHDLIEEIKAYLKGIDDEFLIINDDLFEELNGFGSYQGLGYTCRELPEFQEISNVINEHFVNVQSRLLQEQSANLVTLMGTEPTQFLTLFEHSNNNNYAKKPVLQYVSLGDFFSAFLSLPNDTKRRFFPLLKERLKYVNNNHTLLPEFTWLKSFKLQLDEHLVNAPASVSKVMISNGVKQLEEIIGFIEQSLKQSA
jgi:energy-coupling factor transporter ATP-binding protein EcfA2